MNKFNKLYEEKLQWHTPLNKDSLEELYKQAQLDLIDYLLETTVGRSVSGYIKLVITEEELISAKEQICLSATTVESNQKQEDLNVK